MRYIPYSVVNLYSDNPLLGNPIAVVPETLDLHETEMQSIAGEFNLALTVFISGAKDEASLARLRFFSPRRERIYSGKGTLAAWKAYFEGGHVDLPVAIADGLVQEAGEGWLTFTSQSWEHTTPVRILRQGEAIQQVALQAPEASAGDRVDDIDGVAAALSLPTDTISGSRMVPQVFSCGGSKLFVPAPDEGTVNRASTSTHAIQRNLQIPDVEGIFLFSEGALDEGRTVARAFYPATGVAEDAASGSAVAGLIGYLRANGCLDESGSLEVKQGDELLGGTITTTWDSEGITIGGPVTISRTGTFVLP